MLILRTRCTIGPPLVPICLLILSMASGCVTMKELTRVETIVKAESDSAKALVEPTGYQRLIELDAPDSVQETPGTVQVMASDSAEQQAESRSGVWRMLHQPEEVLAASHAETKAEAGAESALVQVQGFLQDDPLTEIAGDFECINPALEEEFCAAPPTLWSRIKEDHAHYYSKESLLWLAGGFGVGAIIANTSLDGGIQNHLQSSLLGASSDEWLETFHAQKKMGNGLYTLPLFAAAWGRGFCLSRSP
ncbi:hypothetical protein [Gimesia panareensis]|nr:hypothetical protein [Gimesia panareensis]